ncbi:hypothetical protein QVD17_36650 [Tagetes erecta]|uniref:Peptide deformylase n=1 Tax=Tagetes erecta TaxID=13708 RepID=A0AAD8NIE4_TARER|nr:hypothetical protein QVD17_36650 [Tagetes erecta]
MIVVSAADLQFEALLKIVMYPDPILRAKNKRVVTFDENLKKLVDEMFDVMYKTDGIGLSAPQVGINVQLMVFNPAGERGEGEEIVLVNPRVVKSSKKLVPFTEGCLSFPGINADVVRPEAVKGTLFFDRMTAEVVDSIRAELLISTDFELFLATIYSFAFDFCHTVIRIALLVGV